MKPFYSLSGFLIERLPDKYWLKYQRSREEQLSGLYFGRERLTVKQYYRKNLAVSLAVLFWGGGLLLGYLILSRGAAAQFYRTIERPDYGEGSRQIEIEAWLEDESETERLELEIQERSYTVKEAETILAAVTAGLPAQILGSNKSLDEVRSDLNLIRTTAFPGVTIEWNVFPYEAMDETGRLSNEIADGGELIELTATVSCQEHVAEYQCFARVWPPDKSAPERQRDKLQAALEEADRSAANQPRLRLPDQVEGHSVRWVKPAEAPGQVLFLMLATVVWATFIRAGRRLEEQAENRRVQLLLDYPELLFKISMLLGAGLTLYGACRKIAENYQHKKRQDKRYLRYVYEELVITCMEIERGRGEAGSYEAFGKRCRESCYIKLGSILSQNLRKGTRDLGLLLEREAQRGMEERSTTARKLGEEAGTKLLLPMGMMLLVVLIILIVPALLAF